MHVFPLKQKKNLFPNSVIRTFQFTESLIFHNLIIPLFSSCASAYLFLPTYSYLPYIFIDTVKITDLQNQTESAKQQANKESTRKKNNINRNAYYTTTLCITYIFTIIKSIYYNLPLKSYSTSCLDVICIKKQKKKFSFFPKEKSRNCETNINSFCPNEKKTQISHSYKYFFHIIQIQTNPFI